MRHKRKKSVRLRGSTTHGCGSMKKRRGAGNRGGRGNAGSGKKADSKKPSSWALLRNNRRVEQIGFNSPTSEFYDTINVGHLSSIADTLVKDGQAKAQGGSIAIDLKALGIKKLLGSGRVGQKLAITVAVAAPRAKEKIEAAGGSLEADAIADKEAVLAARKARAEARKNEGKKPKEAVAEE